MLTASRNPEPVRSPARVPADRAEMARVLVLGLNLWAVVLAVPALIAGRATLAAGGSVALLLLAGGMLTSHRRSLAAALLLAVYPAALLLGVLALDRLESGAHPPLALGLGTVSLLAYGAVAGQALGRPASRADVRHREMEAFASDPTASGRRWRRRAVLLITGVGAFALVLVAPYAGGETLLGTAWGPSAEAAGTLAAALGGSLGALALGAFVGPGLRKQRPPPPSRQRWRVVMFLVVAASGGVVHGLLQRH